MRPGYRETEQSWKELRCRTGQQPVDTDFDTLVKGLRFMVKFKTETWVLFNKISLAAVC